MAYHQEICRCLRKSHPVVIKSSDIHENELVPVVH